MNPETENKEVKDTLYIQAEPSTESSQRLMELVQKSLLTYPVLSIHFDQKNLQDHINQVIESLDLQSYCIPPHLPSDDVVQDLRAFYKQKHKPNKPSLALFQLEAVEQRLRRLWEQWKSPVFGGLNISQLTEKALQAHYEFPKEYLTSQLDSHLYEFSKKEFWFIRGRIEHGASLFKTNFIVANQYNLFDESVFLDEEQRFSIEVLRKYLGNFYTKSNDLMQQYVEYIGKYRKQTKQEINDEVLKIRLDLFDIRTHIEYNLQTNDGTHSDGGFFNFGKKNKTSFQDRNVLCQQINQLVNRMNQVEIFEQKEMDLGLLTAPYENILTYINQLIHQSNFAHYRMDIFIQDQMKRLNIQSKDDPDLNQLENELQQLVDEINEVRIFKTQLENNAISSIKKFELVKSIQQKIFLALDQLARMNEYYDWKAYFSTLDPKIKHLIEAIEGIPTESWLPAFESWYFFKMTEKSRVANFDLFEIDFRNWETMNQSLKDDYLNEFERKVSQHRLDAIERFNTDSPEQFQNIFKKTGEVTLDLQSPSMIQLLEAFYPIHILNSTSKLMDESATSLAYYVDMDKVDYHFTMNNDMAFVERLHLPKLIKSTIFEAPISQKLKYAEQLSRAFLPYESNLKAFIGKEHNFLIAVSSWKYSFVQNALQNIQLKPFKLAGSFTHKLTEFFLTEASQTYFIYQDFLDLGNSQHILDQQLDFIQLMEAAGIGLLPLKTFEMVDNEDYIQGKMNELRIS